MGNYVVRVVLDPREAEGCATLLEQFRYIGFIHVHRHDQTGMCFDIFEPYARKNPEHTRAWASRTAERMQSFGINAVAAPAWPVPEEGKK